MSASTGIDESGVHTDNNADGLPRPFSSEAIPVILCCDENYFSYAAVVIQSLADNRDLTSNYDIVILTAGDIHDENLNKLKAVTKDLPGISLRLFDLGIQAEQLGKLFLSRHLTAAAYYRLLIPEIFRHYSRVIYLDCDMVVLKDLKPLFKTNLENKAIGAVYDIDSVLRGSPTYINSGLLVLDIVATRKVDQEKNLIRMAMENHYQRHDQDVINIAFEGNIKMLPQAWNLQLHFVGNTHIPSHPELKRFLDEYRQAFHDPAIIHFTAAKPGKDLNTPQAAIFWQYASKTPFRDEMLKQAFDFSPAPKYNRIEKLFSIKNAGNYKIINLLGLKFRSMRKQARAIIKMFSKN